MLSLFNRSIQKSQVDTGLYTYQYIDAAFDYPPFPLSYGMTVFTLSTLPGSDHPPFVLSPGLIMYILHTFAESYYFPVYTLYFLSSNSSFVPKDRASHVSTSSLGRL